MAYSTGLAFSGGGIRSAAFCSGVLHRLLSHEVKVDYLSCVSGGGYTGTGYLDWKYREESARKTNQRTDWHWNFFKHMRENAGYLCHWQKHWTEGILDATILFCLVLLVTVSEPIIMYGSYAFPVAFIIDYLFGKCLRSNVDCDDVAAVECRQNDPRMKPSADQNATAQANREHCRDRQGADAFCPIILFFVLFILFVLCFVLAKRCSRKQRYSILLDFIYTTLAALLALTFFPFSIHDFMIKIPLWTQYLLVFIGVMVWFFLPLLRSKTSYVLIIYCYSYVIYWKVYEGKLLGVEFSGELFNHLLFMSGLAMWLVPLLSASHKRLVHVYNR